MKKITTVAEARSLPEVDHPFMDSKRTIDPQTGVTTVERTARPFCPMPTDGDQILFFTDADGRSMQVCYTPDGPAKTPWR
jgi:putative hemolysin